MRQEATADVAEQHRRYTALSTALALAEERVAALQQALTTAQAGVYVCCWCLVAGLRVW